MLDYFPPVTFGYPEQMIVSVIDWQNIHLPVMHFFAHSILEIEKVTNPYLFQKFSGQHTQYWKIYVDQRPLTRPLLWKIVDQKYRLAPLLVEGSLAPWRNIRWICEGSYPKNPSVSTTSAHLQYTASSIYISSKFYPNLELLYCSNKTLV